jgi:dTDP-4-dehydrorhamnose reductase
VTFRNSATAYAPYGIFDPARSRGHVSAQDFDSVLGAFASLRPDVVINCIGIVKQDAAAKDPYASISVNALFPHRLAQACRASAARLIHISTDCVFNGDKGNYSETDIPDANDLYGRTKLLGEVEAAGCLTIRTSMIGRELVGSHGLIEWFLSRAAEQVRGFRRAVFSGFTTQALADIIAWLITDHPELQGVWNVAAAPINKFDLLSMVRDVYGLKTTIEADVDFACNRSLNAERFREATGFVPPSWPEMIERMHRDTTIYEERRRIHAEG